MKHIRHWGTAWIGTLRRPEMAIFGAIIAVVAAWSGVMAVLLLCALVIYVGGLAHMSRRDTTPPEETTKTILDRFVATSPNAAKTGCLVVGIDGYETLRSTFSTNAIHTLQGRITERLRTALRENDCIVSMDGGRLAVLLAPTRMIRTETITQIAVRLQTSCEMPFEVNGRMIKVTLHCGGCPPDNAPSTGVHGLLDAALSAADRAKNIGPHTIRITPSDAPAAIVAPTPVIGAFLQPRINTDTGRVSGMMMVPRRLHRDPTAVHDDFSETLFRLATDTVRFWDKSQLSHLSVALRFPPSSLRDDGYLNRLIWDIDRYDLDAGRFTVSISNGMLIGPDGTRVQRMIRALSMHGVQIELNGLDTAITTTRMIRTLNVRRLRLPRSLTQNLHQNAGRQRMAATIITMAEQLGLETTAEGITTTAELSLLAQLGCTHVSGPTISPPMPMAETALWAKRHESKWAAIPKIGTQPTD